MARRTRGVFDSSLTLTRPSATTSVIVFTAIDPIVHIEMEYSVYIVCLELKLEQFLFYFIV